MPENVTFTWNEAPVFESTKSDIESRMGLVVQFLRAEVIKSIIRTQPYYVTKSGNRYGLNPSKPGEPPKRVHGDLIRSIVTDISESGTRVIGRYGSTQTSKAIELELGTSDMAARPFLRPPLDKNRDQVKRMLGG